MNKNILLVDDDNSVLVLYHEILKKHFSTVFTAKNGLEALEVFKKQGSNIPVVMFDLNMPKLDGLSMARKMCTLSPYTQFVMITAYLDDVNAAEAMSLGIFCLPKPVEKMFVWLTATKAWVNYKENLKLQ